MSIQWLIGNKHKVYGTVVSCGTIEGEPSRWLKGDIGTISIVPLSKLGENKMPQVIDIETKVIEIIAAVLGKDAGDFNLYDDLRRKHGADIYDYADIAIGLEDEFSITPVYALMKVINTVQQVIDHVQKQTKSTVKKSTLDPYAKDEIEKDGYITVHGLDNKKG